MTNRSNRRTRRRHTKITPAPSSTCRSLQNHNRPKKDDKPIKPPYTPPTHKNNARPPSSNCRPLQNHNRPKKEICYTEPRRTCFCIPYFVSISHTFFNLLRFSPLPRPCLLFLPFLILSRPLPLLCFSFPVIFHIPHFSFIRPLFRFFPPNFPLSHFLCFTFGCPVTAFPFLLCPAGGFSRRFPMQQKGRLTRRPLKTVAEQPTPYADWRQTATSFPDCKIPLPRGGKGGRSRHKHRSAPSRLWLLLH